MVRLASIGLSLCPLLIAACGSEPSTPPLIGRWGASQRAIEALGARKDGVILHHQARRDGTVRDSVMYSIVAAEWPEVKRHLATRLARHANETPHWRMN